MPGEFLNSILSIGENNPIKKYKKIADKVLALQDDFSDYEDYELAEETEEFRARLDLGESLDSILPEAYAVVREAATRALSQTPYPVQVVGAIALHKGDVAQMKTGEGKTLVATMPAYLRALTGEPVHIVTVNEYLAKYQSELMGRVYSLLGMSTGVIYSGQSDQEKREAYKCDIVYGTSSEFGFDYLRDHMVERLQDKTQRGLGFTIIDEIDSILMDEALTPLVIAAPGDNSSMRELARVTQAVRKLKETEDYTFNLKQQTVDVKESGISKVEKEMRLDNMFASGNPAVIGYLFNAVKAKALFRRDKDYIVRNGEIQIVDKETGRVLEGRRFSEGLHQAIEAKENLNIQPEDQTVASITLQNFFRLYKTISGMTGTAKSESGELMQLYKLRTVDIPTNKPVLRIDHPTEYYVSERTKLNAIVEDIKQRHLTGQPVLVGTATVAKSEALSKRLKQANLPHQVLNAKDDSKEAYIVANAGRRGTITVATNMAGRGTDIILGGNPETLAVERLQKLGLNPHTQPEEYSAKWKETYPALVEECKNSGLEVAELGGLYVIGTERQESKRVDNQLRGRAGRQGEPGESRFYASLDDDLIVKYNPVSISSLRKQASPETGELPQENAEKLFNAVQHEATSLNREMRTDVQKYDTIIDQARRHIYTQRDKLLEHSETAYPVVNEMRKKVIETAVTTRMSEATHTWDIQSFWSDMRSIYPSDITAEEIAEEIEHTRNAGVEWLLEEVNSDSELLLEKIHDSIGEENFNEAFTAIMVSNLDEAWTDYIATMEAILDSINLRALAQVEPLQEYRREANLNMQAMLSHIEETLVRDMLYLQGVSPDNKTKEIVDRVKAAKKNKPTPKQKRNNSHLNARIAYESGGAGDYETSDAPLNRADRRAAAKRKKKGI